MQESDPGDYPSSFIHQHHRVGGNSLALPRKTHPLGGGGLEIEVLGRQPQNGGQIGDHGRKIRDQLRGLGDDDRIQVHRLKPLGFDHLHDLGQEKQAGDVLIGRVAIREVAAQIAGGIEVKLD